MADRQIYDVQRSTISGTVLVLRSCELPRERSLASFVVDAAHVAAVRWQVEPRRPHPCTAERLLITVVLPNAAADLAVDGVAHDLDEFAQKVSAAMIRARTQAPSAGSLSVRGWANTTDYPVELHWALPGDERLRGYDVQLRPGERFALITSPGQTLAASNQARAVILDERGSLEARDDVEKLLRTALRHLPKLEPQVKCSTSNCPSLAQIHASSDDPVCWSCWVGMFDCDDLDGSEASADVQP